MSRWEALRQPIVVSAIVKPYQVEVQFKFSPPVERWILSGVSFHEVVRELNACMDDLKFVKIVTGRALAPAGSFNAKDLAEIMSRTVARLIAQGWVIASTVEVEP